MSIQGIRSFDNSDRQTIQFGIPLTLIVGQNGTGKTTIIESLRYATTGDLPPNSKGGAFIHDPKISGDQEVLAQVKLAFRNTNDVQMICTRSMQLTVKKASRTFKTLEGQLMAMKDNERVTISTRCAELDSQMPLYLGVSKSVLDYVIFCHQEDSLWPLSEPSTVKKRFDEIFEATKFTKALDNIKSLRKEYSTDIKLQEKEVQHLKVEKDRGEKAEKKADELRSDVKKYQEDTDMLQQEISQVNEESNKLFESNREFQNILYRLQNLQHNRSTIVDSIKRVSQGLEKRSESDSELQSLIDNFETQVEERKQKKEEFEDKIDNERINIKEYRQKYNEAILLEGQLKAKQQAYEDQIKKRGEFIKSSVKNFELSGFENIEEEIKEIHSDVHVRFRSQINDLLSEVSTQLERERNNAKSVENDFNKEIQDITTKRLRHEQARSTAKETMQKTERDIKDLKAEISSVETDEGSLAYERSILQELEEKVKSEKSALAEVDYDRELPKLNDHITEIEGKVEELNKQLAIANQRSEDRAKYSLLSNDLKRKETALKEIVNKNDPSYQKVIGHSIDMDDTTVSESAVTSALKEARDEVDKLNEEAASTERQNSQVENELTMEQTSKERKEETLKSHKTEVLSKLNLTSIEDYPKKVKECEEKYYKGLEELSKNSSSKKYYEDSIKAANIKNSCLHCRREFEDDEEKNDFLDLMNSWLQASTTTSIDSIKSRVDKADKDLKLAHEMSSLVEESSKLEDYEIPEASGKIQELEQQRDSISEALDSVRDRQEQAREKLSNLESLKRPIHDILRYSKEISDLKGQIQEIDDDLGDASSSQTSRSTSEIHKDITDLNEEAKSHKRKLSQLSDERETHRSNLSSYQNKVSSKQLDINKLEHVLSDKANKEKQLEYLKERVDRSKQDVNECNTRLEQVSEEEKDTKDRMNQQLHRLEKNIQEINDKYTKIHRSLKDYDSLNESIEEYEKENSQTGRNNLEKCRLEVEDYSNKIQEAEENIEAFTTKMNDENTALLDMKSYERNLRDNLELRRLKGELSDTDSTINELEAQNAEQEREKFDDESERLRQKLAQLNSEYSTKIGEIKQMSDQLRQVDEELETEFKNVKENYRKAVIKLRTTSVANEDLAKYSKALDSAIMKYHSLKMEEINSIIDELWKKTYTGTDVDTIIIRSDQENSRGNRTYNYRVCMVKQDVELDMRGRCSAGQKVLASIIIRLALSECFGLNCGLIALDEPTTNLDATNIEALARSLGSIIELRRKQKNFQLIVITHDEQFLTHMNASAYSDHFYRVSRNQRQLSQIQMFPISRVVE